MSVRDIFRWLGAFTLQLTALVFIGSAGVGVYSAYHANREAYRNEKARAEDERSKATDEIAARCNVMFDPEQTLRACLAHELRAYEDKANTDKDLEAQQDMAFWAEALFWLTGLGLAISAFGLYFVWLSLRQTRQAITSDREVGHAQVRAYLTIDVKTPVVRPDALPKHEFNIRNTGQSPAYQVAYIAGFDMLPNPLPPTMGHIGGIAPEQDMPRLSVAASESTIGEAFGTRELTRDDFAKLMEGSAALYMFARVFYEDVFRQKHETSFCGRLNFELLPGHEAKDPRPWIVTMTVDQRRTYAD
jgi:hypothetical protein